MYVFQRRKSYLKRAKSTIFIYALFASTVILNAPASVPEPKSGMEAISRTNLTLKRQKPDPNHDVVFGELYINGVFECYTLEQYSHLIDTGTYPITVYFSPHRQFEVLLLHQVPGHTYIEIHPANYPYQLKGCLAVGTAHNQDALANSRFAFDHLIKKTKAATGLVSIQIQG